MKKLTVVLTLLLVIFTGVTRAQKSYVLAFNPANGDQYDMYMDADTKMTQSYMGQEMKINMKYMITSMYKIAASGANKSLTMTYDKLKMNMEVMGQNVEMSSDDPDTTNPQSQAFRALKGASVVAIVTPKGEVVDVQGTEELAGRLGNVAGQQKETLNTLVGKESIKSMMEQSFKIYPDKPIKTGESWSSVMVIESPYKMTSNNTYTLDKVENNKAYLSVKSVSTTNGAQKMSVNGMDMTVNLNGDMKGTMEVDMRSGMMINSDLAQNIKGKMEVMGTDIPMDIATNTKVELKKK